MPMSFLPARIWSFRTLSAFLFRSVHDRREDSVEVERRAEGPTDFSQRRQLLDRLGQLRRSGLQFLEQPHVLDRNDGLIGEGLQ